MKSFIKEHLKRFPTLYFFLRYKKIEVRHKLLNQLRKRNYFKTVKNLFKISDLNPQCIKEDFPRTSLIEITNACNLNCVMCNTKMSKRPIGFIEPRIFEIILKQLNTIGINNVGLHTVGEPFMYKNIEELLEIAESYGFNVWLSTNGQFPQRIEPLYRKFPITTRCYRFSIDGATRETYESIRRGASFDKLIKSLEVIHKINKGKKNYRIALSIDSILSMTNIFELPLFFKAYGKYCWPENINFNILNGLSPDPSFFWRDFPFSNLIRHMIPCRMPFKSIYFTYSGKATLCCRDYEEELVIGDIQENSIIELWNGPKAESIREKHLNPDKMDIRPCRVCFGTYRLVSDVVNEYIHFLIARYSQLTPRQFGDKVLSLLNNMNSIIQKKDIDAFKQCILDAFKK